MDAAKRGLKQTIDAAIDVLSNRPTDRPFCSYLCSRSAPALPAARSFDFGPSLIDRYDGEIAYTDYLWPTI